VTHGQQGKKVKADKFLEWMIRRLQFRKRTKEAAAQAACAGNARGYHSEYGNSWFNNRENEGANYMFR